MHATWFTTAGRIATGSIPKKDVVQRIARSNTVAASVVPRNMVHTVAQKNSNSQGYSDSYNLHLPAWQIGGNKFEKRIN